jgi:hypothetical protein
MQTAKKFPWRRYRRGIFCLGWALCILAGPAQGQSPGSATLDFSLDLWRARSTLVNGGSAYPADLTGISVTLLEPVSPGLEMGLILGEGFLSLDNDAPSAGLSLSGLQLGLLARQGYGDNPQLQWQAQLLFQRLRDSTPSSEVTVDWYQWRFQPRLRYGLGPRWGLILSAAYSGVNVERRVTGSLNHSLNLDLQDPLHGELEAEILTAGDGRVGLALVGGGQKGLRLSFARRF